MERVGKIFRKGLSDGIKQGVENNSSVFVFSFSALSATKMNSLRKGLRKVGAKVVVSKNRVAKIALKEIQHEALGENVNGQTAFVFSDQDSVAVSKALLDFAKSCEGLLVQGGLLDGNILRKEDVKRLADLPPKEVLQAKLLGLISAPITRLYSALNAKSRELLSILKQLSEKKEGGN